MHSTETVTVAGDPPVAPHLLAACKRSLADFAKENGVPLPVEVDWSEHDGVVHFMGSHEGRVFAIGAPRI